MKRVSFPRLLPGVALIAALFSLPSIQAADLSGEEVYKKGLKSTVWIIVPNGNEAHMGSGSLIDVKQRLVLTNYHVIMSVKDTILVQFPMFDKKNDLITDQKTYFDAINSKGPITAKVLFFEKSKDLAVLQLSRLPKDAQAVRLADDTPGPGSDVHSIGNPGASGSLFVYSPGKVRSSYVKKWSAKGGETVLNIEAKIIESTSPTTFGDSGGPLFNKKGEQTGVTQGGLADAKATGYSYFIDVSEVKSMLKANRVVLSNPGSVSNTPMTKTETPPEEEAKSEPTAKAEPKKVEPKKAEPKKESSAVADERAAESKLSIIRTLIEQGKKEVAETRLTDLIKQYPMTQSAKDAKELLKKLK